MEFSLNVASLLLFLQQRENYRNLLSHSWQKIRESNVLLKNWFHEIFFCEWGKVSQFHSTRKVRHGILLLLNLYQFHVKSFLNRNNLLNFLKNFKNVFQLLFNVSKLWNFYTTLFHKRSSIRIIWKWWKTNSQTTISSKSSHWLFMELLFYYFRYFYAWIISLWFL